ncbi:LOW QUALITY PROTEIN: hypothetical protein CFOL_v3_34289, partial [Cephalotus follicularis]
SLKNNIINNLCSDLPDAFWHMKRHVVSLPYEKDFSERNILTKARPIQMTHELMEPFYVNKNSEIERGIPRLVKNYKPLNTALQIRHPIPNKKDFLKRLTEAKIFSNFDSNS